ncbi:MAG: 50S ribosomal protein L32 [Kiritimatiellae bacterium]|nr:50S ribosomal protein L32 [Kiritimatiellia bacterium]
MAVPKRKVSKSKTRMRKRSHKLFLTSTRPCPNCGELQPPHRVCPSCGYYRGRQVLSVTVKS